MSLFAGKGGQLRKPQYDAPVTPGVSLGNAMRAVIGLLLALACGIVEAQVLAVLEHPQCREDQTRVVRPLFVLELDGWRSLTASDNVVTGPQMWVAVGNDAPDARIQTLAPPAKPVEEWTYVRDFSLRPASTEVLPPAPNDAGAFSGWCDPPRNKPVALLANAPTTSFERLRLPARALSREQLRTLLTALRKSYGSAKLCMHIKPDSDETVRIRLRESDLLVEKDLPLSPDSRLVGVRLRRPAFQCDSELGALEDSSHWFLLERSARYIGSSMQFIQEVRIRARRRPDLLFWYSGYNEDGYVIFDPEAGRAHRFTWKYH